MPLYQEMDEEELRAALAHYQADDLLFGEQRKEAAWLRQHACPRCGGDTSPCFGSIATTFSTDQVMPRNNLKCRMCEAEFDPRTGIIVRLGNIGRAAELALAQQTPWINPEPDEE